MNNLAYITIISVTSKCAEINRPHNPVYTVGVVPGNSDEQTLEVAWQHTNLDNRPHGRAVCSSSVGDIFILNGKHWFCDSSGFREITPEQSLECQKLSSRDTLMGWEWLVEKKLVTVAEPTPDLRAQDVQALALEEKAALGGKLTDAELSWLSRYNE